MPFYEYISKNPDDSDASCRICVKGFELNRPIHREPLDKCPLCRNPVKKVISQVNTPRVAKPFSTLDAKKAGFTVLEKQDEGVYEKQ
ncbi:MAG: FmdB family zinc ribbon protein [Akkermansiaceae bacterium]